MYHRVRNTRASLEDCHFTAEVTGDKRSIPNRGIYLSCARLRRGWLNAGTVRPRFFFSSRRNRFRVLLRFDVPTFSATMEDRICMEMPSKGRTLARSLMKDKFILYGKLACCSFYREKLLNNWKFDRVIIRFFFNKKKKKKYFALRFSFKKNIVKISCESISNLLWNFMWKWMGVNGAWRTVRFYL